MVTFLGEGNKFKKEKGKKHQARLRQRDSFLTMYDNSHLVYKTSDYTAATSVARVSCEKIFLVVVHIFQC